MGTFYIDLIYHLILEDTLRRNHISEPKVTRRLHMLVHLYSIQEHMQGKRLMKCRQCVANVTKLSVGIVIYEIILELIQERNHILVTIVASHFADRNISVDILELIQERNHMLVTTVVNHLVNRGICVAIL